MHARTKMLLLGSALIVGIFAHAQPINLAKSVADGKLRVVNREVTRLPDRPEGVHITEAPGSGIVWIEGSDLAQGSIEVEVRGRDVFQQSFVGIAFHGKDDKTYEGVYLRPFNFRAQDPVRHKHAVQYISMPQHDWPVLREKFPDEFESAVEPSIGPTDWVHFQVVVQEKSIDVYVGNDAKPTLTVRKLGNLNRGIIGLWTGNGSDGDFANLRITPAK